VPELGDLDRRSRISGPNLEQGAPGSIGKVITAFNRGMRSKMARWALLLG
jgi:hypothetical protein